MGVRALDAHFQPLVLVHIFVGGLKVCKKVFNMVSEQGCHSSTLKKTLLTRRPSLLEKKT